MIDVIPFTAPDDARAYLRAQFAHAGDLIACNGHVLIVAHGRGSEALEREDIGPNFLAAIQDARADTSAKVSVAGVTWDATVKCSDCNGDPPGTLTDCNECYGYGCFEHGSHEYLCKECGGGGRVKQGNCASCAGSGVDSRSPSLIGTQYESAAARYIKMLQVLPDCEISARPANGVFYFTFTGGVGALMALRRGAYVPTEDRTNG